jgi:CheY-like chemotaxis protein
VSHEIRTPMNAILGFSEVMLNTTHDQRQKHYLKTIMESGRMLLSLINDILDLSKIEAGRIELSPGPADLRVIVEDLHQLFRQKLEEKNLQFFTEIDDSFPKTILIDEVRLRQILLNLIGNAVKFTSQGYVLFKAEITSQTDELISFELSVIDTGIGISESDYERIFESFSQQSGQDNRKYGGTGLGLAISKRLCELMNGRIGLQSQPDEGSRFYLIFDQVQYSEDAIEQIGSYNWIDESLIFRESTVLIVDDIEYNRQLVYTFLENHNLRIVEAASGEEAVALVKEIIPDLVLMDIRMPGMNGYETTGRIRDAERTKYIPVIALTASTKQREIDYRPNLFNGYIRKPVQKNQLISELIRFLPYDRTELTKKDDHQYENGQTLPIETILPDTLKSEFVSLFLPEISRQAGMIIPDELIVLTSNMADFGQRNQLESLVKICRLLDDAVENFDFEEIQRLLQRLHKLST